MWQRMGAYGMMLGAMAGFLLSFTFFTSQIGISDIIILSVMFSILFGGAHGAVYGGIAGLISGLVMALMTSFIFREIHHFFRFRLVMGFTTCVMTVAVFWFGGLWQFFTGTLFYEIIVAVVIAIYASQIVSKKYLNEIMIDKKKGVA